MADDMEMHMANEMWVFYHLSLYIVCCISLGLLQISLLNILKMTF